MRVTRKIKKILDWYESDNPAAYGPHYHYQLAIEAGLNAYAAPLRRNTFQRPKEQALGMLNRIIDIYLGKA